MTLDGQEKEKPFKVFTDFPGGETVTIESEEEWNDIVRLFFDLRMMERKQTRKTGDKFNPELIFKLYWAIREYITDQKEMQGEQVSARREFERRLKESNDKK